ncbi:hypothetical protein EYF80_005016 [Liparis tanakae]|uniref:Uncharacterized protein n=1 Tax=Liparis tanakae TaxID=230148 RepID=A0A4Z2J3T1_9TELE|nr:hypothetical protein EYF80_005016 [Liparis tanakae]
MEPHRMGWEPRDEYCCPRARDLQGERLVRGRRTGTRLCIRVQHRSRPGEGRGYRPTSGLGYKLLVVALQFNEAEAAALAHPADIPEFKRRGLHSVW